jgi:hypothetical protein
MLFAFNRKHFGTWLSCKRLCAFLINVIFFRFKILFYCGVLAINYLYMPWFSQNCVYDHAMYLPP